MSKRFYLAGPMTGIPQFNFPAFDEAAKALRAKGFDIISPAELDKTDTREAAMASPDGSADSYGRDAGPDGKIKETWGEFLARDVKLVADEVDGLVLLPGWTRSRGARLEAFVGVTCGRVFLTYPDLIPVPGGTILLRITQTMLEKAA